MNGHRNCAYASSRHVPQMPVDTHVLGHVPWPKTFTWSPLFTRPEFGVNAQARQLQAASWTAWLPILPSRSHQQVLEWVEAVSM